jgi:uncharacterized protein
MSEETKNKPKEKKQSKRSSDNESIIALEKEISNTKYNKKTQHAIGLMKAKLAKLKEKNASKGKGQKKGEGFTVRKSGDATVVLLGFPSVGKSTLLNSLTNADSQIGHYAFTTLTCIPGTLEYKSAKIQILDVPGIVEGAASGSGRGKEVLQTMRSANLILIILDPFYPEHYNKIIKEVNDTGVRLNQQKPNVKITKTIKGGIDIGATVPIKNMENNTIKEILRELGYVNATIVLREDISADQLIDVIEANKVYIPAITVLNKVDMATEEQIKDFKKKIPIDLFISAEKKLNIEELKETIFKKLNFIRLYLKEIGKKPDLDEPLIIKTPCTLNTLCERLHKDFMTKFKFARIWGTSVKFDSQKIVKLNHQLNDKDIIELHMR